jgi:hypothetical protein
MPADFGAELTQASLESHLSRIRRERELYRRDFPSEVAAEERIVASYSQKDAKP